jgi:hypothetical protein
MFLFVYDLPTRMVRGADEGDVYSWRPKKEMERNFEAHL